jgi:hypothetical protein
MIALGHLVGCLERFHFAHVDVQSPKDQVDSAFALTYILLLRSCKLIGDFVISPLPPVWLEFLHYSRASSLHGHYPASPLLQAPLRHPLAVHRLPDFTGYTGSLLRGFLHGTRRASPVA